MSDTTPAVSCMVEPQGGDVVFHVLAVSHNDVKYRDVKVVIVRPGHDAMLVEFPRPQTVCDDGLTLSSVEQPSESGSNISERPITAGDVFTVSTGPDGLDSGQWALYLVYLPSSYSMYGVSWNAFYDGLGRLQLTSADAPAITSDPLTYYGLRDNGLSPWALALIVAVVLFALVVLVVLVRRPGQQGGAHRP